MATGIYNGSRNANLNTSSVFSVTVVGLDDDASQTTIDAGANQPNIFTAHNLSLYNVSLINAIYQAVSVTGSLVVENCVFRENIAEAPGASIYSKGFSVVVNNSTFESNSAVNASVLWVHVQDDYVNVSISNSVFNNNSGGGDGGALGVYAESLDATIDNCVFRNNSATVDGGAILVALTGKDWVLGDSSTLVVSNSLFEDNFAVSSGGAVFSIFINSTRINHSQFYNNSAPSGGAIWVASTNSIVASSSFEDNHGGSSGAGAIQGGADVPDCQFIVLESNFTSNFSPVYGGAITTVYDQSLIQNCIFSNNHAYENGGAIFFVTAFNDPGATNRPRYGTVTSSLFFNNTALFNNLGRGGAVGMEPLGGLSTTGSALVIENCNFIENHADSGGALAVSFCAANIKNSRFSGNYANTWGGSIHADISSSVFVEYSTFANSSWGSWGTVLSCQPAASMSLNDCSIVSNNNLVDEQGYGSPVYSGGVLNISNSLIKGNHNSKGDVGALYIAGGMSYVSNSTISNNIAFNIGGIWVSNATANFNNCTIEHNMALDFKSLKYDEAGVLLQNATVVLISTTVSNTTFWSVDEISNLTIVDSFLEGSNITVSCYLFSNTSTFGSMTIDLRTSNSYLTNCHLRELQFLIQSSFVSIEGSLIDGYQPVFSLSENSTLALYGLYYQNQDVIQQCSDSNVISTSTVSNVGSCAYGRTQRLLSFTESTSITVPFYLNQNLGITYSISLAQITQIEATIWPRTIPIELNYNNSYHSSSESPSVQLSWNGSNPFAIQQYDSFSLSLAVTSSVGLIHGFITFNAISGSLYLPSCSIEDVNSVTWVSSSNETETGYLQLADQWSNIIPASSVSSLNFSIDFGLIDFSCPTNNSCFFRYYKKNTGQIVSKQHFYLNGYLLKTSHSRISFFFLLFAFLLCLTYDFPQMSRVTG